LMTRYRRGGRDLRYVVVRLQVDANNPNFATIIEVEDCDITNSVIKNSGEYESNYEAAAVAPDNRLFLSADNEMLDKEDLLRRGIFSPSIRGRGKTPLITLSPK